MAKLPNCKTCKKAYKETDDHEFNTVEHPYDKPEGYETRNEPIQPSNG